MRDVKFSDLVGKTLVEVRQEDNDRIYFKCSDGEKFIMWHSQDCCECVTIDEVTGDFNDLLNTPILEASERTNSEDDFGRGCGESFTWTFYHIATIKGWVTIKWLGESNGYYSESVDFDLEKGY